MTPERTLREKGTEREREREREREKEVDVCKLKNTDWLSIANHYNQVSIPLRIILISLLAETAW